jgi:hypothetical protein
MATLLLEGWAHPHATRTARATPVVVRVVGGLIGKKARAAGVFTPVMSRDVYHHHA